MTRAALFSKSEQTKQRFVESFLSDVKPAQVVYILPKNRLKSLRKPPGRVHVFTYEDMTKTNPWLTINSLMGPETALILENCTRYPKITSTKVLSLEKLEKKTKLKAIVDIVPFTLDIQYLYTPYSYLGRDILGYAHYYAFRENYHEVAADGMVRMSHDHDVLSAKVSPVTTIDYPRFLCQDRTTVEAIATADEQSRYAALRESLFAADDFSPQVAITQLADLSHSFQSRLDAVLEILSQGTGKTLIVCNLSDYAKKAQRAAKKAGFKQSIATSYQVGYTEPVDTCIYMEPPIVKSYFLLDQESRLPDHCKVFHVQGSNKVDELLHGRLMDELTQIDAFTKELYRATHRETQPQAISASQCLRSGQAAYQMDLFQLQKDLCRC